MMIVSNALPIQFWEYDDETYNEKDVCGIEDACWCYPAQWGDEIIFQFSEETGGSYQLVLISDQNITIATASFTEVATGVYQTTITIPSKNVEAQFIIRETGSVLTGNIIVNSSFTATLVPWTNTADGGVNWDSLVVNSARALLNSGQSSNILLSQVFADTSATNVLQSSISGFVTGPFGQETFGYIRFYFYLNGVEIEELRSDYPWSTDGAGSGIFFTINPSFFIYDQSIDQVGFSAHCLGAGSNGVTITMADYGMAVLDGYERLMKSDCIRLREDQECTELVEYSNYRNAFGLYYESASPAPVFQIRLPIVFIHETFPMEQEDLKLSNDTRVRLWNEMARKRNAQIGFVPYYMHQKINLILMHDNVEIDGDYWVKEDPYEIVEGNPRYPLKKANVLLTDRDFNKRNLI